MSAQPIHEEDPLDPSVILRALPEREHNDFLQQYREALAHAAADDLIAYRKLKILLHAWNIRARIVSAPGYYEARDTETDTIRAGTVKTVPMDEGFAEALGITLDEARARFAGSRASGA
jgi:hypothetical protein